MTWSIKLDSDKPVLQDNKVVYIRPDGTEFIADVEGMYSKIGQLNREAQNHREEKEKLEIGRAHV